jgi:hypothetical protein
MLFSMRTRSALRAVALTGALLAVTACTGPAISGSAQHLSSDPVGTPSGRDGIVSGKVVDALGQPVARIGIDWEMLSPPFTSTQEGKATLADGTFSLTLPPGLYRIQAGFEASAPEAMVKVEAGRTVTIRLELPRQ